MKPSIDELTQQHEQLLERFKLSEADSGNNKQFLTDVQDFIISLRAAGAYITNPQQRDRLRRLLNFWASNLYELTEIYPDIKLDPLTQTKSINLSSNIFRLPLWLWVSVLGIMLVLGITLLIRLRGTEIDSNTTTSTPLPIETSTVTDSPTSTPITSTPLPIKTSTIIDSPTSTPMSIVARPEWCVPFSRPSISNTTLEGEVELTFPEDCAEVEYVNSFAGVASGLGDGVKIWVLVYPKNRLYYPQSDDASQGLSIEPVNGRWSVTTYLGSPSSGVEQYDIIVVLANRRASNFIADTLKAWYTTSSYTGLTSAELPHGIMEVQSITVRRTR